MTNKLSERVSSGDISQEVVEAVAKVLGWMKSTPYNRYLGGSWYRGGKYLGPLCPNYLTDIRLTIDEIEQRGWMSGHQTFQDGGCAFAVYGEGMANTVWFTEDAHRPDRNLALAAITALLRALGE